MIFCCVTEMMVVLVAAFPITILVTTINAPKIVRAGDHTHVNEMVYTTSRLTLIAVAWMYVRSTRTRSWLGDVKLISTSPAVGFTRRREAVSSTVVDSEF